MQQKKYIGKSLVLMMLIMAFSTIKSQTSQRVHIKDLALMPGNNIQVQNSVGSDYKLVLKIDSAENGNKIHLLFGTNRDLGDVQSSEGLFVRSSLNSISYNNQLYPISKYSISIPISFSNSYFPSLKFLTVYIEDKQGNISNKLYYSFNP